MNATSQPAVPLKEQIARTIAILIILTGIIDPVFSVTRSVPPVVALLSADSSRHAPLLQRDQSGDHRIHQTFGDFSALGVQNRRVGHCLLYTSRCV